MGLPEAQQTRPRQDSDPRVKHAASVAASARMRARVIFARIDTASSVNFVSLQLAV